MCHKHLSNSFRLDLEFFVTQFLVSQFYHILDFGESTSPLIGQGYKTDKTGTNMIKYNVRCFRGSYLDLVSF